MRRLTILIALLLTSATFTLAQEQSYADSLRKLIPHQKVEAAKMQIKLQIGDSFEKTNADSSRYWYRAVIPFTSIDTSEIYPWFENASNPEKYLLTLGLARYGVATLNTKDNADAIHSTEVAYELAIKINQAPIAAFCTDNLALYYSSRQEIQHAISYFEKSLSIYEVLKDIHRINFCLSNLGVLNAQAGNAEKAIHYFLSQSKLGINEHNPTEQLRLHMNIAILHQQLFNYQSSKEHWAVAHSFSQQLNNLEFSQIASGLGFTAYHSGDYVNAIEIYLQLLEYAKQKGDAGSQLNALNNLAIIFSSTAETSTAIEYWKSTLEVAQATGNTSIVLDALLSLSNLFLSTAEFPESAHYFEQYIQYAEQKSSASELAEAYIKGGKLNDKSFLFQKANDYYAKAMEVYQQQGDEAGIANTHIALAQSFMLQGLFTRANENLESVIFLAEKLPSEVIATAYQNQAELFKQQLFYAEAIRSYKSALDVWMVNGDKIKITECLNTLGSINELTGNLPQAIRYYQQALAITQQQGMTDYTAIILNNIGVVYRLLGDNTKAKESYQEALNINIKNNDSERIAYGYNNMGIIFEQEGNYDEALDYYEKSIELKELGHDRKGLATSMLNLGNIYKQLDKHDQAEEAFLKSLDIAQQINDKEGEAFAYANLAAHSIEQNKLEASIEYAQKNLEIALAIDLKQPLKEAYRQLAWAYENTGKPELADSYYGKIIEINQEEISSNFTILSENEKELFFKTIESDYDRFYSFAHRRNQQNPEVNISFYNTVLRNKGLLLKSSTAMRNAILASQDDELIATYDKWTAIKQSIAQQYALPADRRSNQLEELENSANDLERQLVMASTEFSSFHSSNEIDWVHIKNNLSPQEAAIEFINFKSNDENTYYGALIIKPNSEVPLYLPLFEEKKLTQLMEQPSRDNLQFVQQIYGTLKNTKDNLYKLIWEPLEPYVEDINTIYYSPSGLLHKVSFVAISPNKSKFLIDNFNLQLVSTTANAGSLKTRNPVSFSQVTLFGGVKYTQFQNQNSTWQYLEGTLSEVQMIDSLFTQKNINVTSIIDTLAKEEEFKTNAPQSNIIHIATHGFFYPDPDKVKAIIEASKETGTVQFRGGGGGGGSSRGSSNVFIQSRNPLMRSGLVFAGANDYWGTNLEPQGEDGVLTALEVLNVNLQKTELVVMSACETGLGDISGSEGVYGLQRAFRMAGTSRLIMSLWQVPDRETAEFMRVFYSYLIETNDLNESFSLAQKMMRTKYEPYFWAAFVLLE